MKSNFLFPSKFKKIGWLILIPTVLIGLPCIIWDMEPAFLDVNVFVIFSDGFLEADTFMKFRENNILNEILGIATILGALLVSFSKEKDEDELISKMRLQCLVWATYWNYIVLIIAFITLYDMTFYWVMLFNMFTILILFIIRFNWLLLKMRKSLGHEE